MACKARFLSFGDGFIPSSGNAAGCRSDGTLSARHRVFALPKPDQLDAFIKSDQLSLGPGILSPSGMQVRVPHGPAERGAVMTVPSRWAAWRRALPSDCSTRHPAGSSHLLIHKVPLSFLSASAGVWVGLGCAALDQQERAGTVLR